MSDRPILFVTWGPALSFEALAARAGQRIVDEGCGAVDVLSEILDSVSLGGQVYFYTCFSPPWAVEVPESRRVVRFHLVLAGNCHVAVGEQAFDLATGDLILIPQGASHVVADCAGRLPSRLETVIADTGFAGAGCLIVGDRDDDAATRLLCGHFSFAPGSDHPLLRALPPALVVTAAELSDNFWLGHILQLIRERVASGQLGSETAIRRMAEVVFAESIRCCANQAPDLERLVAAFNDPRISRALSVMHRLPEHRWTVASLAHEAGMSRSRFAERFMDLVGMAPLTYLTEWRLQRARTLLKGSRGQVKAVAGAVGYLSTAAFSRAFHSAFGLSPSDMRNDESSAREKVADKDVAHQLSD